MSDISTDAMMREAAMMDASDNHVWARKVRRLCIERDKLKAQIAALPPAHDAVEALVKAAIAPQLSEGIGAILRKFCDSPASARARTALHDMPDSDWKTLIDMLADASASAALAAIRAGGKP